MRSATQKPAAAALLVRISAANDDDTAGVDRQEKDGRTLAKAIGWTIAEVYVENDTSAYKRRRIALPNGRYALRTVRPEYRRLLEDLETGTRDALIAYDLDRVARDPRDLEDLIDVIEQHRRPCAVVTGTVDLSNDGGILVARMLTAANNKASRDTARRVLRTQQDMAANGQWLGGARPFGFEPDGCTIRRDEATIIRKASRDMLAGVSLAEIIRRLNGKGITTTRGKPWGYTQLRQMLLRPRNAGLITFQGETVARIPGKPIVPRTTWQAVCDLLGDEGRRTSRSNRARWLLAGLAMCGVDGCGQTVKSGTVVSNRRTGTTRTVYRCRTGKHLARAAEPLDEYVTEAAIQLLSRPDSAAVLTDDRRPDLEELHEADLAIDAQLRKLAGDWARGIMTDAQIAEANRSLLAQQAQVRRQLARATRSPVLEDLLRAKDVRAVWKALPLSRRRAVIDTLMTVTLLPSGRLGNAADYTKFVELRPR